MWGIPGNEVMEIGYLSSHVICYYKHYFSSKTLFHKNYLNFGQKKHIFVVLILVHDISNYK